MSERIKWSKPYEDSCGFYSSRMTEACLRQPELLTDGCRACLLRTPLRCTAYLE